MTAYAVQATTHYQTYPRGSPRADLHPQKVCNLDPMAPRSRGSWRAYIRLPREEVIRLRSLVIRGRARPRVRTRAADPVVARVVLLPNELVWKVLAYWRCGVI